MFDPQEMFPEYLPGPDSLKCPSEGDEGESGVSSPYRYFGYALIDEREGMGFLAAYYDHVTQGTRMEDELIIPDRALSRTFGEILRLNEGVPRFYVHDIGNPEAVSAMQKRLPVMLEIPGPHGDSGGHVLYMDGHVAWLPYPGPFPMTPAFIEGIKSVEERLRQERP